MAAIILPAPPVFFLFTTKDLASFYMVAPYVGLCGALWVGAAMATLQDVVLPRMRGTAGATYVLGTTWSASLLDHISRARSPRDRKPRAGIFSLYVVPPFTLVALWIASRRIGELEATRGTARRYALIFNCQPDRP